MPRVNVRGQGGEGAPSLLRVLPVCATGTGVHEWPTLVPFLSRRMGPHEAGEQLAHFDPGGAGCHNGVAKSEGAQAFLIIGLDNAETPRSSLIEDWAEYHHLTGLDPRLPVSGVTGHDFALLVGHVEGEIGPGRYEPEDECSHHETLTGVNRLGTDGADGHR